MVLVAKVWSFPKFDLSLLRSGLLRFSLYPQKVVGHFVMCIPFKVNPGLVRVCLGLVFELRSDLFPLLMCRAWVLLLPLL